jgi:hypothetical protein
VRVVTTLGLHPNTKTSVSPVTPPPFAVKAPETVNDEPEDGFVGEDEAVSIVETGSVSVIELVLRFRVTVPKPVNETVVGSFEPEHVSPPEQLQLERV